MVTVRAVKALLSPVLRDPVRVHFLDLAWFGRGGGNWGQRRFFFARNLSWPRHRAAGEWTGLLRASEPTPETASGAQDRDQGGRGAHARVSPSLGVRPEKNPRAREASLGSPFEWTLAVAGRLASRSPLPCSVEVVLRVEEASVVAGRARGGSPDEEAYAGTFRSSLS